MNKNNKTCEKCRKELDIGIDNTTLCCKCSIDRAGLTVDQTKENLVKAHEQLKEALSKGVDSALIKKIKRTIKNCEELCEEAKMAYLNAMLIFSTDLATLEGRYETIKQQYPYKVESTKQKLDKAYKVRKDFLTERERERAKLPPTLVQLTEPKPEKMANV